MFHSLKHHFKIWLFLSSREFQVALIYRFSTTLFFLGKLIRFFTFFMFLYFLTSNTKTIAGYNQNQIIFFYLTFNLIDIILQIFLRGVYWFRGKLISGGFDLELTKPIKPLFATLFTHTDLIDIGTLFLLVLFMINFVQKGAFLISPQNLFLYFLLIINGLLVSLALHIAIASLGIVTLEIDQLIWIYRDLSSMARYPLDIYHPNIQHFLTFIIPIGIIFTIPAKAFFALLTPLWIIFSLSFGVIFLLSSLKLWQLCLKKYTSASS